MKVMKTMVSVLAVLCLGACAGTDGGSEMKQSYTQISQEEAKKMMDEGNCIVVDVRTQQEYDEVHIPDALCIPLDTIGTEKVELLEDLDSTILVYCRSGNRSKQAAEKLVKIGYTNIYEFGGINTWPYDTVSE